ncbi:hypothetical protein Tco_0570793 [Tanacetum coccineum]
MQDDHQRKDSSKEKRVRPWGLKTSNVLQREEWFVSNQGNDKKDIPKKLETTQELQCDRGNVLDAEDLNILIQDNVPKNHRETSQKPL